MCTQGNKIPAVVHIQKMHVDPAGRQEPTQSLLNVAALPAQTAWL